MNEPTAPGSDDRPDEPAPGAAPGEYTSPPAPFEEARPAAPRSRVSRVGGLLKIAAVFLAVGLLVVLTLQNTDPVTLNVLAWSVTLSRALLVFLLIVAGVVIGWVLRSMRDDDGFRPLG